MDTVAAIPELKEPIQLTSSVPKTPNFKPNPSTSSAPTPPLPVTSSSDCHTEKTLPKTVRCFNRKMKRVPVPDAK